VAPVSRADFIALSNRVDGIEDGEPSESLAIPSVLASFVSMMAMAFLHYMRWTKKLPQRGVEDAAA
jgi:hypothetical protein